MLAPSRGQMLVANLDTCEALLKASEGELAGAVIAVARLLESADTQERMADLARTFRESGALVRLSQCVNHDEPIIHQTSLMLLATLTTVDVDPFAADTKAQIVQADASQHVVGHLFSPVALTVAYACATVQNTCDDPSVVQVLRELGGIERLRELATCDQAVIVECASACLHNLMEAVAAAEKTLIVTKAIIKLQSQLRRRLAREKREREEAERRRAAAEAARLAAEAEAEAARLAELARLHSCVHIQSAGRRQLARQVARRTAERRFAAIATAAAAAADATKHMEAASNAERQATGAEPDVLDFATEATEQEAKARQALERALAAAEASDHSDEAVRAVEALAAEAHAFAAETRVAAAEVKSETVAMSAWAQLADAARLRAEASKAAAMEAAAIAFKGTSATADARVASMAAAAAALSFSQAQEAAATAIEAAEMVEAAASAAEDAAVGATAAGHRTLEAAVRRKHGDFAIACTLKLQRHLRRIRFKRYVRAVAQLGRDVARSLLGRVLEEKAAEDARRERAARSLQATFRWKRTLRRALAAHATRTAAALCLESGWRGAMAKARVRQIRKRRSEVASHFQACWRGAISRRKWRSQLEAAKCDRRRRQVIHAMMDGVVARVLKEQKRRIKKAKAQARLKKAKSSAMFTVTAKSKGEDAALARAAAARAQEEAEVAEAAAAAARALERSAKAVDKAARAAAQAGRAATASATVAMVEAAMEASMAAASEAEAADADAETCAAAGERARAAAAKALDAAATVGSIRSKAAADAAAATSKREKVDLGNIADEACAEPVQLLRVEAAAAAEAAEASAVAAESTMAHEVAAVLASSEAQASAVVSVATTLVLSASQAMHEANEAVCTCAETEAASREAMETAVSLGAEAAARAIDEDRAMPARAALLQAAITTTEATTALQTARDAVTQATEAALLVEEAAAWDAARVAVAQVEVSAAARASTEETAKELGEEVVRLKAEEVERVTAVGRAAAAAMMEASTTEEWAATARRSAEEAKGWAVEQPFASAAAALAEVAAMSATVAADTASEAALAAEEQAERAAAVLEDYGTLVTCRLVAGGAAGQRAISPPPGPLVRSGLAPAGQLVSLQTSVLRPALAIEAARKRAEALASQAQALHRVAEAQASAAEEEARNAACAAGAEELMERVMSGTCAAKFREDAKKRLRKLGKLGGFSVMMAKAADTAAVARSREAEIVEFGEVTANELCRATVTRITKERAAVKAATSAAASAATEAALAIKGAKETDHACTSCNKAGNIVRFREPNVANCAQRSKDALMKARSARADKWLKEVNDKAKALRKAIRTEKQMAKLNPDKVRRKKREQEGALKWHSSDGHVGADPIVACTKELKTVTTAAKTARDLVEQSMKTADAAHAEAVAELAALSSSAEAVRFSEAAAMRAAARTAAAAAAATQQAITVTRAAEEAAMQGATPGLDWPATAAYAESSATCSAETAAACDARASVAVSSTPQELVQFVGEAEGRTQKDLSTTKQMRDAVASIIEALVAAEARALEETKEEEAAEAKLEEEEEQRREEDAERQAAANAKMMARLEAKQTDAAAKARAAQADAAEREAAAKAKAEEAAAAEAKAAKEAEEAAKLEAVEQTKRDAAYAAAKAKRDKMLGFPSTDVQFAQFLESEAGADVRTALQKLGITFRTRSSRSSSPRSRSRSASPSPGGLEGVSAEGVSAEGEETEAGDYEAHYEAGAGGEAGTPALPPGPVRPWSGYSEMSGLPTYPALPLAIDDEQGGVRGAEAARKAQEAARLAEREAAREAGRERDRRREEHKQEAGKEVRKAALPDAARPRLRCGVVGSLLALRDGKCGWWTGGEAVGAADGSSRASTPAASAGSLIESGLSFWPPASEMDRSWTESTHLPWMSPQPGAATSKARLRLRSRERLDATRRELEAIREQDEKLTQQHARPTERTETVQASRLPRVPSGAPSMQAYEGACSSASQGAPLHPDSRPSSNQARLRLTGSQSQPALTRPPRPGTAPEMGYIKPALANTSAVSAASLASSLVRPQTTGSAWGRALPREPRLYCPQLAVETVEKHRRSSGGAVSGSPLPLFRPRYGPGVRAMLRADTQSHNEQRSAWVALEEVVGGLQYEA